MSKNGCTCDVCGKFKQYKCKQHNDLNPPNVAGKWDRTDFNALVHNTPEEKVSFKDITKLNDDIVTISQCGVFVIFRGGQNQLRPDPSDRLGIWNPIRAGDGSIFSWQLILVDYDDNQVAYIQPSKFDKEHNVIQLYGNFTESGFSKENSLQLPAVSYNYMDRI
ncbi:Hypothetical protein HVR_LOCUS282 [uncultured virus]|nr:Hypothetical protein HVR_LOCUS282 [uncultured virus]